MAASRRPVVAGINGSEHSLTAAVWAAAEATRRACPLQLVTVNDDPVRADHAVKAAHEAASGCRDAVPELEVTEEVTPGHPAEEIVRRSAHAQVIVVGSRGHGGFADVLIGSVSASVARHSECPVVVVRGDATTTGPVVVGVDNSPGSHSAVRFAFDAASRRGANLVAVQALPDSYFAPEPFPRPDREELRQQADLHLAEQLSGWSEPYPDVGLQRVTSNEHPVAALSTAARGAQLVVVGHRGRGGFAGLLLGSVATGALHHAPCPVAVVRRESG